MNLGTLLEIDYAERIDLQNNIEVKEPKDNSQDSEQIQDQENQQEYQASNELLNAVTQLQGSSKTGAQPQEVNKTVFINTLPQTSSSQLFLLEVILYSTNILADSSLQNGRFGATSLFGTNEFLQGNVLNMAYSFQCIAIFLKQRKLKDHNNEDIPQLEPFGKAAWTFVSAIQKAEQDQINITDNVTFWSKVKSQFGRNQPSL